MRKKSHKSWFPYSEYFLTIFCKTVNIFLLEYQAKEILKSIMSTKHSWFTMYGQCWMWECAGNFSVVKEIKFRMFLRNWFSCGKKKCFFNTHLSLSILMSKGPSLRREKPRSGASSCMEEHPRSKRTPSIVPGCTPAFINKASASLNWPNIAWICFLWINPRDREKTCWISFSSSFWPMEGSTSYHGMIYLK